MRYEVKHWPDACAWLAVVAIPETSAQIEVMSSDGAYVPFKVRPGERGETEIHIVVHELR